MVIVEALDVQPERDKYRANGETDTRLWLDPDKRRCGAHQWQDDYANGDYVRGTMIQDSIVDDDQGDEQTPDEKPLREYLQSPEGQALLDRACEGWEQTGENGEMDDDADEAWSELINHVTHSIPSTAWSVWDMEEWFNGNEGLQGTETDEEIDRRADVAISQMQVGQIVDGYFYDYLIKKRDELRAKLAEE